MQKFIVKSLAVSGLGKKIFRHGDFVTEENFPKGNFKELLEKKHIEEVPDESGKSTELPPPPPVIPPADPVKTNPEEEEEEAEEEIEDTNATKEQTSPEKNSDSKKGNGRNNKK